MVTQGSFIHLSCSQPLFSGSTLLFCLDLRRKRLREKINKKEFKQTKAINTFLYIQIFTLALGITPYAIINASQTVDLNSIIAAYVLYCGAYILATIFCVIFIFIPPIYPHVRRKWAAWTSYIE